jgi:acyl dehydratase
MVDASCIGRVYAPYTVAVLPLDLVRFAAAIGETHPEYVDADVARAAGHPGLPIPPTFASCLEMKRPAPFEWLRELGIDVTRVLHGAQSFHYLAPVYAGDVLTFSARIIDVAVRRKGALIFIVRESGVTNQHGASVMQFRSTIIVRAA